jgi:hypothetical protein
MPTSRSLDRPGLVVVPFHRGVAPVAQQRGTGANVGWVLDCEAGCGAVSEEMRAEAPAEGPPRVGRNQIVEGLAAHGGATVRHPERLIGGVQRGPSA